MKLTYISTYPPRECGLATFNKSLLNAINANLSGNARSYANVVALNEDNVDQYEYPDEVKFVIRQQVIEDYCEAADFVNLSNTDACVLQHEFGIYGGDNGIYLMSLINRLEKPLISIFHTVLERPSYQQKTILQNLAKRSDKIVVMGRLAVNMLHTIYGIPLNKIHFIEHGAPDLEREVQNPLKSDVLFKGRKILLTFGLINRNKGLETVIRALPKIVEHHPDVLYVILGNTHPGVIKNSGEEYREHLVQLAKKLNVSDNLLFINRYVSENDLFHYLTAADIYISPYLNEAQITSGTLAYAVGAGAAVVATPYWHAKELLAEGRGRLFNFKNEEQLANIIN
jgi:glycosyltransferase involved in cell wall biosynthesis